MEDPQYSTIPRELASDEAKEIIQDFAKAALRAQKSGFDGVEVDACTSFLIGKFISPHFNKRSDEYGGDFDGRMRFPVEIIRAISGLCGRGFPIGVKLCVWEEMQNGIDHDLVVRVAQKMAAEGVAYLHPQTTAYYPLVAVRSKYPTMSPMYLSHNTLLPLAENLKRNVKDVPIMTVGGILEPEEADKIISEGKADMIVLGRAIIADPDWAIKAKEGNPLGLVFDATSAIMKLQCSEEKWFAR